MSCTMKPRYLPDHTQQSNMSRLESSDLSFPPVSRPLPSSTVMEIIPRRFSYSMYETTACLPPSQQPLPEPFPTVPSQMQSWTHPFDPTTPITPQMWIPNYGFGQHTLPSPMHQQQSPFELSLAMVSPLSQTRTERSHSLATSSSLSISTGLLTPEHSPRESFHHSHSHQHGMPPQPDSPGHADLNLYGWMTTEGAWKCAYPGCTSRAVFTRGCDLRKHHKRHTKSFFCRYPGCTQASGGGFSSKKDLARHEAKHNPGVVCEWAGCERIFSRVDNMRDHVKRIHLKANRGAIVKNRHRSI